MNFGKGYWKTFEEGIEREWMVSNGIGGYAGDSIIGAHTRKHHGLLIASLHPPVERYMAVSRIIEKITVEGRQYCLAAAQRQGGVKEEGQRYLQRFRFDAVPVFEYHVGDVHINKVVSMENGKNTTGVGYELRSGAAPVTVILTPCFNFREHGESSTPEELTFSIEDRHAGSGMELRLKPEKRPEVTVKCYCSEGTVSERGEDCYDRKLELQTEIDTGMSSEDNNYCPYDICVTLKPFELKKISVILTVEEEYPRSAFAMAEGARARKRRLINEAINWQEDKIPENVYKRLSRNSETPWEEGFPLFAKLAQAADRFIVDRKSTGERTILAGYPWFTDWGRDTMIAMQGLTMVTGRLEDAKSILRTFARYMKDGLVPNMFPDEGLQPLYNTVDASLWYIHSVDQYLKYAGQDEEYGFVEREIYPCLQEIIKAYRRGTSFSIFMDEDGLLHAGGGTDQITWMDVRVGDWVPTPRHGKPVEINALWYNALKVMEELTERFLGKEQAEEYAVLAERVKASFCAKFWNPELNCLYDVVEEEPMGALRREKGSGDAQIRVNNSQIRPNQIYAVSLPHTALPLDKARAVVSSVFTHLYATYGLRSLSVTDPEYRGRYAGALEKRDAAYHQGTAWAFPLGAFVTAYVKAYHHAPESVRYMKELLEAMEDHLADGCIGQIAEIFDGDAPHISRGCYAQAWSVGEILRAYAEDVLAWL